MEGKKSAGAAHPIPIWVPYTVSLKVGDQDLRDLPQTYPRHRTSFTIGACPSRTLNFELILFCTALCHLFPSIPNYMLYHLLALQKCCDRHVQISLWPDLQGPNDCFACFQLHAFCFNGSLPPLPSV